MFIFHCFLPEPFSVWLSSKRLYVIWFPRHAMNMLLQSQFFSRRVLAFSHDSLLSPLHDVYAQRTLCMHGSWQPCLGALAAAEPQGRLASPPPRTWHSCPPVARCTLRVLRRHRPSTPCRSCRASPDPAEANRTRRLGTLTHISATPTSESGWRGCKGGGERGWTGAWVCVSQPSCHVGATRWHWVVDPWPFQTSAFVRRDVVWMQSKAMWCTVWLLMSHWFPSPLPGCVSVCHREIAVDITSLGTHMPFSWARAWHWSFTQACFVCDCFGSFCYDCEWKIEIILQEEVCVGTNGSKLEQLYWRYCCC